MPQALRDAIRRTRSELNEPAVPTYTGSASPAPVARQFTDTEITDWINDGLRDVARRAEVLLTVDQTIQVPAFIPTTLSQIPLYSLNLGSLSAYSDTDIVRINRIEFVPVNQTNQIYVLSASTQNEMDQIWGTYQQNTSTYPRWYVTRGYPGGTGRNAFTLQVYPCPSQAGTLNIFYYRLPIRISDPVADPSQYQITLDIPEGWDDMVVEYAVVQGLKKERDPEWKDRKQEYEEKLADMVDVTRKFHDQQSYISYGTNQLPAWLVGGGEF
jgi:hypothetical protein